MLDSKLWTVGIVNFHTVEFIACQLEILHLNNPGKEFDVIIVDNSLESEFDKLNDIASNYQNITIIKNSKSPDPWMRGSGQHGEGLNIILKNTKTKYLLVHDPDFFWVGKHYLLTLERYLDSGYSCVGAPYRNFNGHDETGGIGKKDFPAAFGAAYKVSDIINLGFMPAVDKETYEQSDGACWLSKNGADVGWKIRSEFSNSNYYSFNQRMNTDLCLLGSYSYETIPYEYRLLEEDKFPIAYHLFRGSFGDDILSLTLHGRISRTDSLVLTRQRYGNFFQHMATYNMHGSSMHLLIARSMIFYRKHIYGLAFIDNVLNYMVYRPLTKSIGLMARIGYKIARKVLFLLEGYLYVLTHPVLFISTKFKKMK